VIVGTAGHIDHGKTTLVRALTGVDTDRLPEEKKRGITIELGYAFMDDGRIGFIDVPGHERLVHTMLAGATGIDFALLLVAADDGVMPQTREHLAVLSLLGVSRGAVAVTKADRVEGDRLDAVCAEAHALLRGTSLAGAPVLAVSAHTGAGIGALKSLLQAEAARAALPHDEAAAFRLAVDRAFTLDGVGTVVTGTVHAGRVRVGDELVLAPASREQRARVRSLHAQNRPVAEAGAGQRCAVALVGVARDDIERGQWLVHPAAALATDRIDVQLTLWQGEPQALRSGTPVHVHLGAAAAMGTVAMLDAGDTLAPGATARVQLVLRSPVGAWHGDRVVLRDASASRTLAGGVVLDPLAPARYRRTPQRLAELDALALPGFGARRDALLAVAPHGVDLRRLSTAQGRVHETGAQGDWAIGPAQRGAVRAAVLAALAAFHARAPEEPGPDAARLRRLAAPRLPEPLWANLLAEWVNEGALVRKGAYVQLPEHGAQLSATEERIAQKVAPLLAAGRFDGVWARDMARDAQESEALVRTALARLAQRGELHQVVKDLYYAPVTMATLAGVVREVAATHDGEVTAAAFRDATGLGRKRAIQILEHFDHIGLLRRVGDVHRLRSDTRLFLEAMK
jgi:selenocysteine-specific elongation factor